MSGGLTRLALTQRERNRIDEHSRDGHMLVEGEQTNLQTVGGRYAVGEARLYSCRCGWLGWLPPGISSGALRGAR
jgi:hypothetical protein